MGDSGMGGSRMGDSRMGGSRMGDSRMASLSESRKGGSMTPAQGSMMSGTQQTFGAPQPKILPRGSQGAIMDFPVGCLIFLRILLWFSCIGLSATVMIALKGISVQEVFRCPSVYLISALPTVLYIVATSTSMKEEYQSVRPMNQTMTGQEFTNPTSTFNQANNMAGSRVADAGGSRMAA